MLDIAVLVHFPQGSQLGSPSRCQGVEGRRAQQMTSAVLILGPSPLALNQLALSLTDDSMRGAWADDEDYSHDSIVTGKANIVTG